MRRQKKGAKEEVKGGGQRGGQKGSPKEEAKGGAKRSGPKGEFKGGVFDYDNK